MSMILLHKFCERSFKLFVGNLISMVFYDGRAIAVCTGNKEDVVSTYSIPQKSRKDICVNENTANVSKVKAFVTVGHSTSDNGFLGEGGAFPLPALSVVI